MMEQDRKEYLDKDESEKMCSSKIGEAGEMCSPADTDTCRDCLSSVTKQGKSTEIDLKKGISRDLLNLAVFRNLFFRVLTIASYSIRISSSCSIWFSDCSKIYDMLYF